MKRNLIVLMLVCFMSLSLFGCSNADEGADTAQYPDKTITLIVNYGAGGGTDLASRALSQAAEKALGQPITIKNVSGGSGSTGVVETQNSDPDGYTVGILTAAPLTIVPYQMDVPYNPDDFDYIGAIAQYGYGIGVKADSEYQSIDDIVEAAKAMDGGLAFSASGFPQPFAMDAISKETGAEFTYIPYQSATDAITAVMGGHVEFVVSTSDLGNFIESGEMRMLAACGNERWPSAPDVPTLTELGYDAVLESYIGIGAPKGLTEDQLATLEKAFLDATEDPEFIEIRDNMLLLPAKMTGDEYEAFINEAYENNKALIEEMTQ